MQQIKRDKQKGRQIQREGSWTEGIKKISQETKSVKKYNNLFGIICMA